MAQVTFKTPVAGYTGVVFGVPFANGVGSTEDPWLAQRLRESGYQVVSEAGTKPTTENTVAEIKAYLEEAGIEFDGSAKKDDLLALIEG